MPNSWPVKENLQNLLSHTLSNSSNKNKVFIDFTFMLHLIIDKSNDDDNDGGDDNHKQQQQQ